MNMCWLHYRYVSVLYFLDTLISLADEIQGMPPCNNEEGYEKINGIIRSINLCSRRIKLIVIMGKPKMRNKVSKAFITGVLGSKVLSIT